MARTVAALSPRGDMAGRLVESYADLALLSAQAGARYLQVGGFSSLRPSPDAAAVIDEIDRPAHHRAHHRAHTGIAY